MLLCRQLAFRPSSSTGIEALLTVRSAGHYQLPAGHSEENRPRNFTQVFWILNGRLEYHRAGRWHMAGPRDSFYYTAGEPHHIKADGMEGCEYYWVTFDAGISEQWMNARFPSPAPMKSGECPVDWFEELITTVSRPTTRAEKETSLLGFRLLLEMATTPLASGNPDNTHTDDFCSKVEQTIQRHYPDPDFGIQEAARLMNLHRTSLFRLYRESRGISPSEYLQRMRLGHGLELLKNGGMNISEIALASGFRDPNYFAKVVRKATGESPMQIRKRGQFR